MVPGISDSREDGAFFLGVLQPLAHSAAQSALLAVASIEFLPVGDRHRLFLVSGDIVVSWTYAGLLGGVLHYYCIVWRECRN